MKMNYTKNKNLWDKVSNILTKLFKKDDVVYRVKARPESADAKLCKIGEGR